MCIFITKRSPYRALEIGTTADEPDTLVTQFDQMLRCLQSTIPVGRQDARILRIVVIEIDSDDRGMCHKVGRRRRYDDNPVRNTIAQKRHIMALSFYNRFSFG